MLTHHLLALLLWWWYRIALGLARYLVGKEGQKSDNTIVSHFNHLMTKSIVKILLDKIIFSVLFLLYTNKSSKAQAEVP